MVHAQVQRPILPPEETRADLLAQRDRLREALRAEEGAGRGAVADWLKRRVAELDEALSEQQREAE